MPSPKPNRNGTFPKFSERSMSFNGKIIPPPPSSPSEKLRRPKTVPDLKSAIRNAVVSPSMVEENNVNNNNKPKKLTKVLLNVTVQGSIGAVQVLISPELCVRDLVNAAVKQYVKEGRRPVVSFSNADDFDLHYSQFSLESLEREEKIAELGSRNFFLCKRRKETLAEATAETCSKQAEKATKLASTPWLKFMSFLF